MASNYSPSPFDSPPAARVVPAMRGAAARQEIRHQHQQPIQSRSFRSPASAYRVEPAETFDTMIGAGQRPTAPQRPHTRAPPVQLGSSKPATMEGNTAKNHNHQERCGYDNFGTETDKGYFLNVDTVPEKPVKRRRRFCGCCCCGGRICAIIALVIAVVLGIAGYFLWPRMPGVQIDAVGVDGISNGGFSFEPDRYSMSQSVAINVTASSENYIPWKFNSVSVQIKDTASGQSIGEASARNLVLQARDYTRATLTGRLEYRTANQTDPTWRRLVTACSGPRSDVPIRLIINVDVPVVNWFTKPSFEQPSVWKCPADVAVRDPLLT